MTTDLLFDLSAVRQAYPKGDDTELVVLDGVDMQIREGEIVGLLGRSGCGKSTVLRIIGGLLAPTSGTVLYYGKPVHAPPEGVAMVFQSFALFPWLTVLQNAQLGLDAQGMERDAARKRALAAIDLIGLDGFESAYPKELSGGMRQRVGLARALVVHPNLLLMDEPFSALDVLTAETLRTDLIDLWTEGRLPVKSILMVTHNIEEAVLMCDRVVVLSSNPGHVMAELKIDLPHPRNRQDLDFRQHVDTIYGHLTRSGGTPSKSPAGGIPGTGIGMVLRGVSVNVLAGFLEALAAQPYDGHADLPHIAGRLHMGIDDLFPVAEALQLVRFVEVEDGDARLTHDGRTFVAAGTDARKRLFRDHLLQFCPLVALIRRVLDERRNHSAPATRFREELEDHMSEEDAGQTLRTAVSWGRYGEVFAYDERTARFTLDNPA